MRSQTDRFRGRYREKFPAHLQTKFRGRFVKRGENKPRYWQRMAQAPRPPLDIAGSLPGNHWARHRAHAKWHYSRASWLRAFSKTAWAASDRKFAGLFAPPYPHRRDQSHAWYSRFLLRLCAARAARPRRDDTAGPGARRRSPADCG